MPHAPSSELPGAGHPPSAPLGAPVTAETLEACLTEAVASSPGGARDGRAGLFGPGSALWQVDREALVFLGAARALLLQLAHPWVAEGVAEHSVALQDPLGRFHRTFGHVYAMVFGTTDQALTAARRLHRRHGAVTGTLAEGGGGFAPGSAYQANRTDALAWVHATLADTALRVHDMVLPPLDPAVRERYWQENRRFGLLFGIPADSLPDDWAGFQDSCRNLWGGPELTVTRAARHVAWTLFSGGSPWMRLPGWYLDLTAMTMPPALRDGFGLAWGPRQERRAKRVLFLIRRSYPLLPTALRHVGPYREAAGRLAGRERPAPYTRLLNRAWIGRPAI
ncbi:oxygenase MpaB family protein [Indioceanicola profundi]|uniref:oxygenase MpaB family protein n=1 Tax=Indioceanicola profundi TaxID=2220096 RepID=UPI000E6ABB4F|nr:oxygenase MpaB family protein [Indioceanicola profundi]